MFQAQQHRDNEGRCRWAVLHLSTRVWYFPTRYGRLAAQRLANRLNKEI